MNSRGINKNFTDARVDALAVVVFKDDNTKKGLLGELDKLTGGGISSVLASEEFKGESGETYMLRYKADKGKAGRILLVGGGDQEKYKSAEAAACAGAAARKIRDYNLKKFAFAPRFGGDAVEAAAAATQGAITSQFELDKYKTKDKNEKSVDAITIFVDGAKPAELKNGIEKGTAIGESMNFTRDLANEPPNILTPTEMANRAKKMAKEVGLTCEVLTEAQMKKMGMNSLLSVSLGSEQPAKLIFLKYTPKKSTAKKGDLLALVGKGVMFDTGGISLKPGEGMDAMKYDMSGGATVVGAMRAIALLKPSVPVIGVVGCVENMPDGKASRPSDVVTAMNGKTVEILNTDAEGRLVLADAVHYAEKKGANQIIDLATLTGAVIIALGNRNTGIMGNDQDLVDRVIETGKEVGEGFWQLPLEGYESEVKSDIADVKNIGTKRRAGTIAGGLFIQEFIDKAKWAHLDIAGTAWADSPKPHQAKGPTGVAIRTLVRLVENSQ
ncbi:MAG: leucyl aminopeptidase [Acidobacteria bacterium]|nr:MAG: leucyl aminopeptidase [Acidobacteriota bacterium]REK01584.1 MAG: leucyl aminopeptidase [Acidobacteriota bacterium]REK14540.1 MAG: leucyl aminopeptidase [Acidobacteriota bacterium]REK45255.1 MAG: leucyl aminopeptidase [Acidobacteriota bacterium]